jgi:hypothetical protein
VRSTSTVVRRVVHSAIALPRVPDAHHVDGLAAHTLGAVVGLVAHGHDDESFAPALAALAHGGVVEQPFDLQVQVREPFVGMAGPGVLPVIASCGSEAMRIQFLIWS